MNKSMKTILKTLIISIIFITLFHTIVYSWDLALLGELSETFDDNINASADNPEYDFYTTLMVGFGVEHEGKTFNFSLIAHVFQDLYIRNSEFNANSQDAELILEKQLSRRTGFSLSDTFHHYPQPRSFDYIFGRPAGEEGYWTNNFNFEFNTQLFRQFDFGGHYSNTVTENRADYLMDSISHEAGGELSYSWTSANIPSCFYNYIYTNYSDATHNSGHSAGLSYEHYFTRQLYGIISGGFNNAITATGTSYSPLITVSLIDDIDENNEINLTFTRGLTISPHTDEIFDNWNISATLTRQVWERLTFDFTSFYGQGQYRPSNNINKLFGLTTSLSYEIKEDIHGSIEYSFTRNKTEMAGAGDIIYYRNIVTLSISAEL